MDSRLDGDLCSTFRGTQLGLQDLQAFHFCSRQIFIYSSISTLRMHKCRLSSQRPNSSTSISRRTWSTHCGMESRAQMHSLCLHRDSNGSQTPVLESWTRAIWIAFSKFARKILRTLQLILVILSSSVWQKLTTCTKTWQKCNLLTW